ncbi:MAG: hypothetical protein IT423_15730 [Pirellulaceae bacterium]|nr:hypothetical protein [Pirellulaceae bacterium]
MIMRTLSPVLWLSLAALASSLGCTMCSTEHMCDYPGVGGKWQRGNPTCGRVGSTLSDAGAYQSGSTVEFGANYGESWGLVDPNDPTLAPDAQIIDGELFEGEMQAMPEPGAIMIGP